MACNFWLLYDTGKHRNGKNEALKYVRAETLHCNLLGYNYFFPNGTTYQVEDIGYFRTMSRKGRGVVRKKLVHAMKCQLKPCEEQQGTDG